MRRLALLLLILLAGLSQSFALEPSEMLDDPALEARARDLSAGLRCMVCQNQSIDDSDADLARDLRVLVRERILAGETDEEVIDYVVSRYGEFVLLRPRMNLRNAFLWGTPVLLLVAGGSFIAVHALRRRRASVQTALSAEEERKLSEILDKTG
ncbi:cytochrome c-type biogenesis protein [Mesorhizobium sp. CAU 1741]|uniref:cytochrome c-type biogenesis protein n=1 Tax=Mesorhizobium sp. CAU 1741 TaxID=3140366 RepID=UPI00325A51EF